MIGGSGSGDTGTSGTDTSATGGNGGDYVPPQAVQVSGRANERVLWSGLSAAGILAAVLIPPFLGLWLRRRQPAK